MSRMLCQPSAERTRYLGSYLRKEKHKRHPTHKQTDTSKQVTEPPKSNNISYSALCTGIQSNKIKIAINQSISFLTQEEDNNQHIPYIPYTHNITKVIRFFVTSEKKKGDENMEIKSEKRREKIHLPEKKIIEKTKKVSSA